MEEDRPEQAAFDLINHIQQRKSGEGDKHTTTTPQHDHSEPPPSAHLIDHVGPVGGGQHGDVSELLDAVHLCQELSQDTVTDTTGARGAEGEDENGREMSGRDPKTDG